MKTQWEGLKLNKELFVRVHFPIFSSGLFARMDGQTFKTLVALSSFMNEKGECYPTQEQVAERMGVHKNTARKYINILLEMKFNGKPILTRQNVRQPNGHVSSFYQVQPISQIAIFGGQVEEIEPDTSQAQACDKPLLSDEYKPLYPNNNQEQEPYNNNHNNGISEEEQKKIIRLKKLRGEL